MKSCFRALCHSIRIFYSMPYIVPCLIYSGREGFRKYKPVEDDISAPMPSLTSVDWTPSSPVNHRSDWTPCSWTENTLSFSRVILGAFTTSSHICTVPNRILFNTVVP